MIDPWKDIEFNEGENIVDVPGYNIKLQSADQIYCLSSGAIVKRIYLQKKNSS